MAISTTREELTDEKEVTIFDHLEERRGRLLIVVAEACCSWSSFSFSCSCSVWIILPGSNEIGFWRSDAVGVEIHCCQCCDCSCHCHSLNRYIDTMSCGRPTHWVVHRRRFLFIFLRARSCR
ncbi:unnamed protein product [Sphagnum balticum]